MPKCIKLFDVVFDIVDTITEENFPTYEKLQVLSCVKLAVGDIIAVDEFDNYTYDVFTPEIVAKNTRYHGDKTESFRVDNKIFLVYKKNTQYEFMRIEKEDIGLAKFIFKHSKPKIGNYIVEKDVYTESEFLAKFKIINN